MPDLLLLLFSLSVFDAPIECSWCEEGNRPQAPFNVYGNTWYVGTDGLSSILIETDDGLVLADGGLAQSAALIDANIRALGFDPLEIKAIIVSHPHYDHDAGRFRGRMEPTI